MVAIVESFNTITQDIINISNVIIEHYLFDQIISELNTNKVKNRHKQTNIEHNDKIYSLVTFMCSVLAQLLFYSPQS